MISIEKFKEINNTKLEEGKTIKYEDNLIYVDPRNDKLGAKIISELERLNFTINFVTIKLY